MPRQRYNRPTNKVMAGSLGAALATIGLFVIEQALGEPLPAPVQTAVITVVTFAVGYLFPPSVNDAIDVDQPGPGPAQ